MSGTTSALSLSVASSLAVLGIAVMLTGCGHQRLDKAATPVPPPHITSGTSAAAADRSAAVAKTLGTAGFHIANSSTDTLDQQQAQVLILNGAKARATLTFQDDNSGLREQFASIRTLADGTEYATQHMGYGGVSVVVFREAAP